MNKLSDQWRTPQWLFDELDSEFHFDIDICATKENTKCGIFYSDYLRDVQVDTVYYSPRVATMQEYQEIGDANYICFMNPPYSNPKPFIEKAWEDSKHCKIVCLVKGDPSTKWWSIFWDYTTFRCVKCRYEHKSQGMCPKCYLKGLWGVDAGEAELCQGPKPGCEVRFFPKSIKFGPPKGLGTICKYCDGTGLHSIRDGSKYNILDHYPVQRCVKCKGKGYKELSGPTFPSALLIFDRRFDRRGV